MKMATVSKESNVSQVNFRLEVSEVSKLKKICSPTFSIQGVPWRVYVTKTTAENEHFFSVQLCCEDKKIPSQLSYAATASFKVLPFNGNVGVVKYLEPNVFDSTGLSSKHASLRWIELFDVSKNYVKNDTVVLEIQIDVVDPNDESKTKLKFESIDNCCKDSRVGTFKLTVGNIDKLIAVRSPEFRLRNIPWFLTVFKQDEYLGICIDSRNSRVNDAVCNITLTVKFITMNGNTIQRARQTGTTVTRLKDGFACGRLITWDDLFNPHFRYIRNGKDMTFEIEVSVEKPETAAIQNSRKRQSTITIPTASKSPRWECTICNGQIETQNISSTSCGHLFCTTCIVDHIKSHKVCPTCNTNINLRNLRAILPAIANEPRKD